MATTFIPARHFEASWPGAQAPARADEGISLDLEPPRARGRRIASNVVGWLCIAGFAAFSGWMVTTTTARDAIASWGTMGKMGNVGQRPPTLDEALAAGTLAADAGVSQPPSALSDAGVVAQVATPDAGLSQAGAAPAVPARRAAVVKRAAPPTSEAPIATPEPWVPPPKVQETAATHPDAWRTEEAPNDLPPVVTPTPPEPMANDPYEN